MEESVLVVGIGQMGPGIALSIALGGYDVVLSGRDWEKLQTALASVRSALDLLLEVGLVRQEQASRAWGLIRTEIGFESAARTCSYVVEAIAEDLAAKRELLGQLQLLSPPNVLLASTTSGFMPSQLQEGLTRPECVIVTHYGQPAYLLPVCEVATGALTSPLILERACNLLRTCAVRPVICREIAGFLWNRLQFALLREALALVRGGIASVEDIEAILKYGYGARLPAIGPFEHADLVGLDLICTVGATIWPTLDCSKDPSQGIVGEMMRSGELGMKTGQGFYDWTKRDPVEFRRQRDLEIIRRVKVLRAGR